MALAVDWQAPAYNEIYAERYDRLKTIRNKPSLVPKLKKYYSTHPWDFISDWGVTYEPRNPEVNLPAYIPFVLWDKQVEYLQWVYTRWQTQERGLVEKSRDCGVTWLSVGFAVTMWLFVDGFSAGFGSRKEEYVDRKGDPDSIFEKLRIFVDRLPRDFKPPGFDPRIHSKRMMLENPKTGASITGEIGDDIGRGGRKSVYFGDEVAFLERQELVDRALSQNTNCQIDISTPNGNGNLFFRKRQRFNNTDKVFIFDWRDDPRKDEEWYKKMKEEHDEVTIAQEIDRDYNASQTDSFIPAKWVAAAIDAHVRLDFRRQGIRSTGFDPADVGDAKAVVNRHGSVILEAIQTMDGDITQCIPWAFDLADFFRADVLVYDGDGLGTPTMKQQLQTMSAGRIRVAAYHGSADVAQPTKRYGEDTGGMAVPKQRRHAALHTSGSLKTNEDMFLNYRAQSWTWVRDRFKATYDAVQRAEKGQIINVDPEALISLDSRCTNLHDLQAELSRPKRIFTPNGKVKVESKADMAKRGVDSPNLADALVMAVSVRAIPQNNRLQSRSGGRHRPHDPGMGY